jgi:thiol-disulfide isomerase/thioredoxin
MSLKVLALRLALCAAALLTARTATALDVGDKAPAINIKTWVSNTPVTPEMTKGKILVVEFLATWHGPAKAVIPHFNKLQAKYQDKQVILVGVTREEEAKVQEALKTTPMTYHVGIDNKERTHGAYLKNVPGLPYAVVADAEGKVAWQGHPLQGMDRAVEQLLAGTFDMARAKKLAADHATIRKAFQERDIEKLHTACDKTIQDVPDDAQAYRVKRSFLLRQGKQDEAEQVLAAMAAACAQDPEVLADVAGELATRDQLDKRDLPRALALAQKAVELTKNEDGELLAILARIHYELGHLKLAISLTEKAAGLATDEVAETLKARTEFYRKELARRAQDPDAK